MKTNTLVIALACAAIFSGCAATVPLELVNAREAYRRASAGPAAQVALAELHVAAQALAVAERSFQDNPDSYQVRDLAYVSQRKSELATATAAIKNEQMSGNQANRNFQATQSQIVADTKQDLKQSQTALNAAQQSGQATAAQLATEQAARAAAEKRASEALLALAKLGAVKEEPRGMVMTLSGSVLFASNQAVLLPEARTRLDQVAAVLLTTRERNLTIEGHTDSQGSDANNLDLSRRRAEAVRTYIVSKGYEADLVKANGLGEGNPIASNDSAEGRANNRRVEIIIAREATASNP